MQSLRENGLQDVHVFLGGIIPEEDMPELMKMGVAAVYGPGTETQQVVEDVRKIVSGQTGA
jgi:methylmalonyl-CoA mutase C-terminal domain/subunit